MEKGIGLGQMSEARSAREEVAGQCGGPGGYTPSGVHGGVGGEPLKSYTAGFYHLICF